MEALKVFAAPLPFSDLQVKVLAMPGSTIQEIVDNVIDPRYGDAVGAIVEINSHRIPRDKWRAVRPKEGSITIVRVVPMGGKGGKNPLATILSIAVLVAAPYAVGALGFTSLGLSASTLTLAGRAVAAGFGLIGSLLVNAIAPPPKPSSVGAVSNPAESPTQFIEGASNTLDAYGVIPVCLGTNRIFPKLGARNFTETVNNEQYARQIFTWSYGTVVLDQFQIGDTDIAQFDNVQLEHRLAGDLNQGVSLYANDVAQDDYNVLLKQVDGFTQRTSATQANELTIDVTFPQGLSKYNDQGTRVAARVQLELQYSPAGLNQWSPGAIVYSAKSGAAVNFATFPPTMNVRYQIFSGGAYYYISTRIDIMVVNIYTGVVSRVAGNASSAPVVPANCLRIATVTVTAKQPATGLPGGVVTTITMTDDRQASLFGTTFQDSSSFVPSLAGTTVTVSGGSLLANQLDITATQAEALRRTVNIPVPTPGQYDVRIRRITADTVSDKVFDKVYLSAVRTITYRNPWSLANVSGSAMRIKATDQLNGVVNQFNALCSTVIPDYDALTNTWVNRISSNPASIYRYVLQGPANAKPLPDSQIAIDELQAWHIQCTARGYTYNRVIDYETSVADVLADVAAAGAAAPNTVDGKRTIVVDLEKTDIVQVVTPRNSWNYSGTIVYPSIPHALRTSFRNPAMGYQQDEVIVFADGYNADGSYGLIAATIYESLELVSCTDSDLAYKTARRHFAVAKLRPETHVFMMDVENLVALRGQRIKFASDVPQIGVGDGRIKKVNLAGTSPNTVASIVLDDTIGIPTSGGDYYARIRKTDGTQIYAAISETLGNTTTLTFRTPLALATAPQTGDLVYVVQAGKEADLIISKIEPQQDLSARITAVNYAPEIFTAESGTIPPFFSNLTPSLSLTRPVPPVLVTLQSDEAAMVRNSDGSITSRMVITLQNDNDKDVDVQVSIRATGSTIFSNANVLEATPQRVILTGLDDSTFYDVAIRYRRDGSNTLSAPLLINSYKFIGAGTAPSDVTGFVINVVSDQANLAWDPSPDIDFDHWQIRFSSLVTGATWDNSLVLEDRVLANRLTTAMQSGTYLIKAVDIAGNFSTNAVLIEDTGFDDLKNIVDVFQEDPAFAGVKVNTAAANGVLTLDDIAVATGTYQFANTLDFGDVFTFTMAAALVAGGGFRNNLFAITDLFAMPDMFATGGFDLFGSADLFAESDLYGIGSGAWEIELQYRTTQTSPAASPLVWSDWMPLVAGTDTAQGVQFRAVLTSLREGVTPVIFSLSVTLKMQPRIIADKDLVVPITGLRVNFTPPYLHLKGIAIAAQNMAPGDVTYIDPALKDETGFTIRFYDNVGGSVQRTFDFAASGLGQVVT